MIELGMLRIATNDGVPFAREKLRSCLVAAGLKRVVAGQIVSILSQDLRGHTPAELCVFLDKEGREICIQSPILNQKYNRIHLPKPLGEDDLPALKRILSFLTREELLHDLERQVEERTAELKKERERSEKLLQNMLPEAIATRMKDGETIADQHQATVVFVDIAGFTAFARDRHATEVVSMLDGIFRTFDAITRRHGLEKIKTIGDGYLAAAGLPEYQIDHVDRAVMMGLDIVGAIPTLREELAVSVDDSKGVPDDDPAVGNWSYETDWKLFEPYSDALINMGTYPGGEPHPVLLTAYACRMVHGSAATFKLTTKQSSLSPPRIDALS